MLSSGRTRYNYRNFERYRERQRERERERERVKREEIRYQDVFVEIFYIYI